MNKKVENALEGVSSRSLLQDTILTFAWLLCGLVVKSSWVQIQRSRVQFPVLPDFLGSNGFGTQPREYN
jgi:hypothetical protein